MAGGGNYSGGGNRVSGPIKDSLMLANDSSEWKCEICKIWKCLKTYPFDSSVGRAVDCRIKLSDIHRSLVQIRLEGDIFVLIFKQEKYHTPI
jgi:hypothetical protein